MPKFDTSLDSGALTTLAGLGALAYFTRDKKDGKDKKDKAAEALTEAAKEKPNSGSSYTGPIGNATNDPVSKAAPEPQDKQGFRGKAAGKLPSKPYPLKTSLNEDRPSKPFPTDQAAQTKAAMAGDTKTAAPAPAPAPAKTTTPAKPATAKTSIAQGKPVGSRFGDKDRSLLDMVRDSKQGRADFYADKRKKEEMRNKSLASQMDSTKDMKKGGSVRSTASKRGDGIAKRGFTRA
jgi:hypothetical protein